MVFGVTNENQPFYGIRILDLGGEACALSGRLLAGLGAQVIKVEDPVGSTERRRGPFLNDIPDPEKSLSFCYMNAGKLGITLNLKSKDGQAIFKKLVKTADVVIESFPVGHLDNLGIGFEALNDINSGITMASITPFGQTGPNSALSASSELIACAAGGLMFLTGEPDKEPLQIGNNLAAYGAGGYAAVGILAALHGRLKSGHGEHIDISMQDVVTSWLDMTWGNYQVAGNIQERFGSQGYMRIPASIYPCKDGYFFIIGIAMWDRVVSWLIEEGLDVKDLADEKYMGFSGAKLLWELLPRVSQAIRDLGAKHTKAELMQMGQDRRIPVTMVVHARDIYSDPHLEARSFFAEVDNPNIGRFKYPDAPAKFTEPLWSTPSASPRLGQHNEEIYKELGFQKEHLEILRAGGTI